MDLTSNEEVYGFLVKQGVPLQLAPTCVRRKGLRQPLEQIAHAYPLVRKVLAWWDLGRDLGFLRRWAGHSRIHPVWGQTRSATSRIYARNPAVQNVSRNLRHLFVPAPGHVLIKADYSQAQMRIIAHLSQDPDLMRIFNDPNVELEAIDFNPCLMVKRLPENQRDSYLSWEDFNSLLENSWWLHDIIVMLYYTGMRFNEAVSARWEMFKPDRRMLILPPDLTKEGKGGKKLKLRPKRIPLRREPFDLLQSLRCGDGENVVRATGHILTYTGRYRNHCGTHQKVSRSTTA
ncbi:MAG: DNA polymerase [Pseudomonadota bacterium]